MSSPHEHLRLNLLQRLDLALANRVLLVPHEVSELSKGRGLPDLPPPSCQDWVAGTLGLRGIHVRPEDVEAILDDGASRFAEGEQERHLIEGMVRVFDRISSLQDRRSPEGWALVDLFKDFTRNVARFRNNCIRKDLPWDAILFVDYPSSDNVTACLDAFRRANCYTDLSMKFEQMHPVRQSFRVLWLLARIAPFPDFNLTMAWVAMNQYLVSVGYPMLVPDSSDRERLHRLVGGPVPLKVLSFESRLLESVEID